MNYQTKLAIRRWMLRKLRLLFDAVDDRLHGAEIRLRLELATISPVTSNSTPAARSKPMVERGLSAGETFVQWEARRSGIAPIVKQKRGRRHVSAAEFSRRFA